jgi:hypothetical protein
MQLVLSLKQCLTYITYSRLRRNPTPPLSAPLGSTDFVLLPSREFPERLLATGYSFKQVSNPGSTRLKESAGPVSHTAVQTAAESESRTGSSNGNWKSYASGANNSKEH